MPQKITADADVVDTCDIANVFDMVSDTVDRCPNRAMFRIVCQPLLAIIAYRFDGGIRLPQIFLHFPYFQRHK